jgi:hypothetical protein
MFGGRDLSHLAWIAMHISMALGFPALPVDALGPIAPAFMSRVLSRGQVQEPI